MTTGTILFYGGLAIAALSVVIGGVAFVALSIQKHRLLNQLDHEYGPSRLSKSTKTE